MKFIPLTLLLSIYLTANAQYLDSNGNWVENSKIEEVVQYNQVDIEEDLLFGDYNVGTTNYNPASGYTIDNNDYDIGTTNYNIDNPENTIQYEDSSYYISCFPSKYKAEKGEIITWTVIVNSPTAVTYEWEGDDINRVNTSKVITEYSSMGEKKAYINVNSNSNITKHACGSVIVVEPSLSVSCSVEYRYIEEGTNVMWSADISGGDGLYNLKWSGHTAINDKKDDEVTIKYKQPGSYSADLEVRSGSQTRTVYCGNVIVSKSYTYPLSASCKPNKLYTNQDEIIEWKIDAIGGGGNYDYKWRGTDSIDGKEKEKVKVKYSTLGPKYAEAEVCSSGDCIDIQCGSLIVSDKLEGESFKYDKVYTSLEGSCISNKNNITVGEEVMWQAKINQPITNSLFLWNGTDELNNLHGAKQIVKYKSPGVKKGSFSVRTNTGELFNFVCLNIINVEPLEPGTGLLSFGQLHYKESGGILKMSGLIILLLIWVFITIFIIRKRIGKRKITKIIKKIKKENIKE